MVENVDITLLAKLCQDTLAETRAIRHDLAAVQRVATKTVDVLNKMEQRNEARSAAIEIRFAAIDDRFTAMDSRFAVIDSLAAIDWRFAAVDSRLRGIDQRIGDLKDDLEPMIKSELMGALGNFEVRMMGLIEERLARRE